MTFIIVILFFISFNFFDYEYFIGGGFFYKISRIYFNSNYIFFISSLIGSIIFFNLEKIDKKSFVNLIIVFLSFFIMTYSYMIFQKYFEPTFIIVCLFFLKSRYFLTIFEFNKNLIYISSIALSYLLSVIIYNKIFL